MKPNLLLGITGLIVALGAIPAGLLFILHPDGSAMQISLEMLQGSPFHNFLIPGLFLFAVNGLCQLAMAVFSFRKHPLAGSAGLTLGIILILWIIIQVSIIGLNSFLQYTFFIVGLLEIVLAWRMIRSSSHVAKT